MLSSPLQKYYRIARNVRPVRYAYFVADDDFDNLDRIMRFSCTQWGGIRSILIPVTPEGTFSYSFQAFLWITQPDGFISYVGDRDGQMRETIARHVRKWIPDRLITVQDGPKWEEWDRVAHTLNMVGIEYPELLSPHADATSMMRPELVDYRLTDVDAPAWLEHALYGAIGESEQDTYFERFNRVAQPVDPRTDNFWDSQFNLASNASALNLTSVGLTPRSVEGGSFWIDADRFDVVVASNVTDVCRYWDLRALRESLNFETSIGRRTLLLPRQFLDQEYMRRLVNWIRRLIRSGGHPSNLHAVFYTSDEETTRALSDQLASLDGVTELVEKRITQQLSSLDSHDSKSPPILDGPVCYAFAQLDTTPLPIPIPVSIQYGVSREPAEIYDLLHGKNELRFEPPQGYRKRGGGTVIVSLESDLWQRYPRSHRVAESIVPHSWFSRDGLTWLSDVREQPQFIQFDLVDEWESLRLHFSSKGYEIRQSNDGRYATAVARLLGGIQGIDTLKSRPAYELLELLALRSTKKIAQRIVSMLGLRTTDIERVETALVEIEAIPELRGIPKTFDQISAALRHQSVGKHAIIQVLDRLTAAQVVRRGFYLWCPDCGAPDWHALAEVAERVNCAGCGASFTLPVESPRGSEIHWQYRLNSLVNRAVDQDTIPSLLALRHLTADRHASCIVSGLELVRDQRPVQEFDFLFVADQRIYAGECKAGRSDIELKPEDFKRAEMAATLGFAEFHFCTVNEFSIDSMAGIEQLSATMERMNTAMHVGTITGQQLFREPEGT
jgi:hypothetical protein